MRGATFQNGPYMTLFDPSASRAGRRGDGRASQASQARFSRSAAGLDVDIGRAVRLAAKVHHKVTATAGRSSFRQGLAFMRRSACRWRSKRHGVLHVQGYGHHEGLSTTPVRHRSLSDTYAADRAARQQTRSLDLVAFDRLRDIRLNLPVPVEYGGFWGSMALRAQAHRQSPVSPVG
jgi:hypothetical protein